MRYGYLRDPLFVGCLLLYFLNRWIFKPYVGGTFVRDHLNDVICIPFWVPITVYTMRRMGLRESDASPCTHEIVIPLLIWSVVFEVVLPQTDGFRGIAIADHVDVLCYSVGALAASVFWKLWYRTDTSVVSPRCRHDF